MSGKLLWQGTSKIDGNPVVAIATEGSNNRKTGKMIQVWIMRADVNPIDAVNTGKDKSVCGDCPFRGSTKTRSCYVNVVQAPLAIYKAYAAGKYETVDDIFEYARGKLVRVGAYGDPAAVPVEVWVDLLGSSEGWTGYTHQWRQFPHLKSIFMASCESLESMRDAKRLGYRTFRVRIPGSPPLLAETECLNIVRGITCQECGLCRGGKGPDVTIELHGPNHKVKKAIETGVVW